MKANKDERVGNFTDRESGTYAGLMLSLHDYRDRLEVHTGFKLNRKPRELDCLMIDRLDDGEEMDNDIARFFRKHNIIELKNPAETLNIGVVWKAVSYAAQYISQNLKSNESADDVTVSIIRASKPRKSFRQMSDRGYRISNDYPGIYYIYDVADVRMQIVVTSELKGDEFAALKIQKNRIDEDDLRIFANQTKEIYLSEIDFVEMVLRYGIYDFAGLREMDKEAGEMDRKNQWREYLKEFFDEAEEKGREEGRKEGRKELQAQNNMLKKEIEQLKKELKKAKTAML